MVRDSEYTVAYTVPVTMRRMAIRRALLIIGARTSELYAKHKGKPMDTSDWDEYRDLLEARVALNNVRIAAEQLSQQGGEHVPMGSA